MVRQRNYTLPRINPYSNFWASHTVHCAAKTAPLCYLGLGTPHISLLFARGGIPQILTRRRGRMTAGECGLPQRLFQNSFTEPAPC